MKASKRDIDDDFASLLEDEEFTSSLPEEQELTHMDAFDNFTSDYYDIKGNYLISKSTGLPVRPINAEDNYNEVLDSFSHRYFYSPLYQSFTDEEKALCNSQASSVIDIMNTDY
jgi:hypothetical protein